MSSYINFYDKMQADYWNMQPSEVKGRANDAVQYHKRFLWTKLFSVYKFGLPEEWKLNYFRNILFKFGSIAVIYTSEYGWIPQSYGILEHDIFYNPKKIQVYNQFIKNPKVGIVGINCGIVKVMDDYFGLDDLVTHYATMLAQIDKAFNINLMTTNTSVLYEVEDKKQADVVKEAVGRATTGEPFVVVKKGTISDSNNSSATVLPKPTENYLADKLLDARARVVRMFLTDVGIQNANTEKKERLISDEVNQNNQETKSIVSEVFDEIKRCFDEINSISGLNLTIEWRWKEEDPAKIGGYDMFEKDGDK